MFDINEYLKSITSELKSAFGSRLCYVGIQGSYMRGEATDSSDIDIMAVIDFLSLKDLDIYKSIIGKIGESRRSCGFICGKEELARWNPLEICQLVNTTQDIYGKLTELVPLYLPKDEINYIKVSLDNLYHELCHRYIHGKRENTENALPYLYKSAYFILQNLYYVENFDACNEETKHFVKTKSELLKKLKGSDRQIIEIHMGIKSYDYEDSFEILFDWCRKKIFSMKNSY